MAGPSESVFSRVTGLGAAPLIPVSLVTRGLLSRRREVLDLSEHIGATGAVSWRLMLCLLLTWILVFLFIVRGVRFTGKVRPGSEGEDKSRRLRYH